MEDSLRERIIDKQFEMIGCDLRFRTIPKNSMIEVEKKKKKVEVPWWLHYRFDSREQYEDWANWAIGVLQENAVPDYEWEFKMLDFEYGMTYQYKKEEGE